MFKSIMNMETEEQETARLSADPEGSRTHELSKLPITIREAKLEGFIIELHWEKRIVVVPLAQYFPPRSEEQKASKEPRPRDSSWDCVVIASDYDAYPVGGYHITVPTVELRRGKRIEL